MSETTKTVAQKLEAAIVRISEVESQMKTEMEKSEKLSADLSVAVSNLVSRDATISNLEMEKKSLTETLESREIDFTNYKTKYNDAKINDLAASKALVIVASQGVPPLKIETTETIGNSAPISSVSGLSRTIEAFKNQMKGN